MEPTGIISFPAGSLDAGAQEFWPAGKCTYPDQAFGTVFFRAPPPSVIYYPYACPYPAINEVTLVPTCDERHAYLPPLASSPAYVGPVSQPVQPTSLAATRSLLLSSLPIDVSETAVRRELEAFGDVRGVQMERARREGIVTVHFYDLRHAERAFHEIREQHMKQQTRLRDYYNALMLRNSATNELWDGCLSVTAPLPPPAARGLIVGHAVWAQFVIPATDAVPDGRNQGTIVVFNLDSDVSAFSLREIFETFGPVKELRETPLKKHQKFVEFYDVRDAARALNDMKGKEIHGKPVVIEFSRPGGQSRKFLNSSSYADGPRYFRNPRFHPSRPLPVPPPPPPPFCRRFSGRPASNLPPRAFVSNNQFSAKKVKFSKCGALRGNNSAKEESAVLHGRMASLNLDPHVGSGSEETETGPLFTKNSKTMTVRYEHVGKNKLRKGKHSKKLDSRYLINEDAMVAPSCRDSRTTVMIKNIPNKYSQKLLLNMLDNHCIHCNEQIADGDDQPFSSYDFVYLPIDFNNKCNVGYGFVNLTSPEAAWRLYKAFHLQPWEVFNSKKICEVTYARVQGLEALKEHFKNSKFPSEMDHYLPVVFSPPREGKRLTEPLPVVGLKQNLPTTSATPPPDDHHSAEDAGDTDPHFLNGGGGGSQNDGSAGDDDEDFMEGSSGHTVE